MQDTPETPREILVVKPSSLGDVVHTLPAVAMVKARWPNARLRWVINPEWAPLLAGNPHVDEVILFPRAEFRGLAGWGRSVRWARALRERVQADLVLDFQGLLRSALIARRCRGEGGRIVGLGDAREGARFFYDQRVDVSGSVHAVDRYLALAGALGCERPARLEWPLPEGNAPAAWGDGKQGNDGEKGNNDPAERFVVLHPFSRGEGKSLTAGQVADFCRALAPHRVLVVGRSDAALAPQPHVTDLLNQTSIAELIWLLRRAAFVVSVDSGPMHMAAALTERLVSIHTWSDPAKVGPYRSDAWVWQQGRLFQRQAPGTALPVADCAALAAWVSGRLA